MSLLLMDAGRGTNGTPLPPPPYIVAYRAGGLYTTISGLTYVFAEGPSNESATFQILADGLSPDSGDITVTPSADIEVWNGSAWTASAFTIPYTGGAHTSAEIYKVRFKAGLVEGPVTGTLSLTGADAPLFSVAISGTVTASSDFIITIKTDNAGTSASDAFTLPLLSGGAYAATIYWGDGTSTLQTTATSPTHTYPSAGTYQIRITGTFPSIRFNNGGDRLKLLSIDNWGNIVWGNMSGAFYGCSNMVANFSDTANTAAVLLMNDVFRGCTNFNGNISGWNTANATIMSSMFNGCTAFNQSLSSWNTAQVTSFASMFSGCTAFNQSVSNFNTSSATGLGLTNMFFNCPNFNQSVSSFDTSGVSSFNSMFSGCTAFNQSVSNFDTSLATNMDSMFLNCVAFNQSVSNFNTANVLTFSQMLRGCAAFNQSVSNFDTSSCTNFFSMFRQCTVFNQDLSGFDLSAALTLSSMLMDAPAFNQPLSAWDTSNVNNMQNLFSGAVAFNQNIGGWNVANVTNFASFMQGKTAATFSTANLDAIYNGWSASAVKPNIVITFGSAKYTAGGSAGRAVLTGAPNNWTITDGGI